MANEITLDDIPNSIPQTTVKSQDVSYSAILAGGDPKENYFSAKEEISRTGDSTLVQGEKTKWLEEQAASRKKTVSELITDPSISAEQRLKIGEAYLSADYTKSSLRDKFISTVASSDWSDSPVDQEAQTKFADNVYAREKDQQEQDRSASISSGVGKLKELGFSLGPVQGTDAQKQAESSFTNPTDEVILSMGSKALVAIPAGIAAGYALMMEKDSSLAKDVLEGVINDWSYSIKGDRAKEMNAKVSQWIETLDTPFQWAGDTVRNATIKSNAKIKAKMIKEGTWRAGNQEAFDQAANLLATGVYTTGSMIGYTGALLTGGKLLKVAAKSIPGTAFVKIDSPMAAAEVASKGVAAKMAAKTVASDDTLFQDVVHATKAELVTSYALPKIEHGDINILPDMRKELDLLDKDANKVFAETEFNPHVDNVDKIMAERAIYEKVFSELAPYQLLSSSVLDITPEAKLFGRAGKDAERFVSSTNEGLKGTAIFGRNPNFGYATKEEAANFAIELGIKARELPDPGVFKTIERDGQHYIQWDFKTKLVPHEMVTFGPDTLSAHFLTRRLDVTTAANSSIGGWIYPPATRMKGIVAESAATFLKEGRIESVFLSAQRAIYENTKHPKELILMAERAEAQGKKLDFVDFQEANKHLTTKENQQLYSEYMGFRRIQEHLYRFADRTYGKNLVANNMKTMYDEKGNFVTHATEPILREKLTDVRKVWDLANKRVIDIPEQGVIVRLNSAIKEGNDIVRHALVDPAYQSGPIRPGSLNKIPEYIARHYKERYVVDKEAKELFLDGNKIGADKLSDFNEAMGMAKTQKDADKLAAKFKAENPSENYIVRKEQKDVAANIIDDSKIYEKYTSAIHKRGDKLSSLEGDAQTLDLLASQTKSIRSIAKVTAWEDITKARKEAWVKEYKNFTIDGMFPTQVSRIVPKKTMYPKDDRALLTAQSIYKQMEREQLSSVMSDRVWKAVFHKVADGMEKINFPQEILREWGDKGFIPTRVTKSIASDLFIHLRPLRQHLIQIQQLTELTSISPAFASKVADSPMLLAGLSSRRGALKDLNSGILHLGEKTNKEYRAELMALEESGIFEAVDMNQMITGWWNNASKELTPKIEKSVLGVIDRATTLTSKTAEIPGKVARKVGFDQAEALMQINLWKFAKYRWEEANPGKEWNTVNNRAEIQRQQILLGNTPSTRAGMMPWQDGTISNITQFAAQPHRSLMQVIGSHELTGGEKARLAAGRILWYGIYGVPYGAAIYAYLERNAISDEAKEILNKVNGGISNLVYNGMAHAMLDETGETTNIAASKSISTVNESLFMVDIIHSAIQVMSGEKTNSSIPSIKGAAALFDTAKTIKDIFTIDPEGIKSMEAWKIASWKAVSFAGGFSDYEKALMVDNMSKKGQGSGYHQTTAEAIARLWGVPPTQDVLDSLVLKSIIDRQKAVKNRATDIHQRLIEVNKATGVEGMEAQKAYWSGLNSFLNTIEPEFAKEVSDEIFKMDKQRVGSKQDSMILYMYNHANDKYDSDVTDMINYYKRSTDPTVKAFITDLEKEQKKQKEYMKGNK